MLNLNTASLTPTTHIASESARTVWCGGVAQRATQMPRTHLQTCPSPKTTPQMPGKFHFQADLKGLRLPVTFTIPDMPESLPFKEPLGPRHSWIFPERDSRVTETVTQKPRSANADTVTSAMHTNPLEIDSHDEGSDLLGHLSVRTPLLCAYTF
jgi:hypothetical protein